MVQLYQFLTMENKKTFREVFDFPCVEHSFFQNVQQLTLNESISCCTKWSTQIKLAKMKNKDSSKYYRKTLQSPNLINLYPKPKTPPYLSNQYSKEIQQDFFASQCKLCKEFFSLQNKNMLLHGFSSLEDFDFHDTPDTTPTVPPSLCHFTWINTALNGFQLGNTPTSIQSYIENYSHKRQEVTLQEAHKSVFRSDDANLPKIAVMGGSVTAT